MKQLCSLLLVLSLTASGWAQDRPLAVLGPLVPQADQPDTAAPPTVAPGTAVLGTPAVDFGEPAPRWSTRGLLTGNHNFDNFIGFMSNPVMNIDPRAVTELWPVFDSDWVSRPGKVLSASGNSQLYGAGVYVALSERLSIGLCQGGYAVADFNRVRQGWLNLGGFGQYTLIQNVPRQFLLTSGLRWAAPTGEAEVFQGHGPAQLAPYLTMGKGFGNWHLLATAGYQFPLRNGDRETELYYFNGHLDRQCFGWLYPLVEVNWIQHATSVDINRPFLNNFFNTGTFDASGNIVSMAAGFNAVLVPSHVELGAVYTTSLSSTSGIAFNGVLVKLVLRY
jgi:hypothetical protein